MGPLRYDHQAFNYKVTNDFLGLGMGIEGCPWVRLVEPLDNMVKPLGGLVLVS